jgi:DNA-binding transcriptional ArsR family regulator
MKAISTLSASPDLSDGGPAASAGVGSSPESTDVCDVPFAAPNVVAEVRSALIEERTAAELAATFAVLGDPTRVRLLDALAQRELCVCELAELVGLSDSAVSHQLRLLRSLRLVRSRRSGRMVHYALDDDHIRSLLTQSRRHIEEGRQ